MKDSIMSCQLKKDKNKRGKYCGIMGVLTRANESLCDVTQGGLFTDEVMLF